MTDEYLFGIHAVAQRLKKAPDDCVELTCLERPNSRLRDLIEQARASGISVKQVSRDELERLCGSDRHQGCVLRARPRAVQIGLRDLLQRVNDSSLILVLDGVQDPHNLGACLRTADAAGVEAVIIPKQRAAGLTATVRKVAAGAAESVPVIEVTNITRSLEEMKKAGIWVYGTCGEADSSLYEQRFSGPAALVMGGEGDGLRRLTREHCDHLVSLPMRGQVESLNVSVATGICLYEIQRARGACGDS